MVEDDLKKLENKGSRNMNIWKTIKEISKKKEVVIRPADKGGGLVILNKKKKKDYEEEMENLLKVEKTYNKLKVNPKQWYEKKPESICEMLSESTKTPVIYYLPKIHNRIEKPPGRPIISRINLLFSRLGEYLDQYLKPLVQKGKSYLRDSTQSQNLKTFQLLKTVYLPP